MRFTMRSSTDIIERGRRVLPVDSIVHPAPRLLNTETTPFLLGQQSTFRHHLGDVSREDDVPATDQTVRRLAECSGAGLEGSCLRRTGDWHTMTSQVAGASEVWTG